MDSCISLNVPKMCNSSYWSRTSPLVKTQAANG